MKSTSLHTCINHPFLSPNLPNTWSSLFLYLHTVLGAETHYYLGHLALAPSPVSSHYCHLRLVTTHLIATGGYHSLLQGCRKYPQQKSPSVRPAGGSQGHRHVPSGADQEGWGQRGHGSPKKSRRGDQGVFWHPESDVTLFP